MLVGEWQQPDGQAGRVMLVIPATGSGERLGVLWGPSYAAESEWNRIGKLWRLERTDLSHGAGSNDSTGSSILSGARHGLPASYNARFAAICLTTSGRPALAAAAMTSPATPPPVRTAPPRPTPSPSFLPGRWSGVPRAAAGPSLSPVRHRGRCRREQRPAGGPALDQTRVDGGVGLHAFDQLDTSVLIATEAHERRGKPNRPSAFRGSISSVCSNWISDS
jgi:hypothetical protein